MKCAAMGCRRRCHSLTEKALTGLCYKHNWWYGSTPQADYAYRCTTVFPLWSAEDVMIWLTWCGI